MSAQMNDQTFSDSEIPSVHWVRPGWVPELF
jgi:hypothetical protein